MDSGVDTTQLQQAMDEVLRIETKYSRYRPDSIVSRINAAAGKEAVHCDSETMSLMGYAAALHGASEGLFDITSGQVVLDGRNLAAGPLMSAIHIALAGWRPDGSVHAFHRTSPGKKPQYPDNGGMYPLSFSIDLHY